MVIAKRISTATLSLFLMGMSSVVTLTQAQEVNFRMVILEQQWKRAGTTYDYSTQLRISEEMLELAKLSGGRRSLVLADDIHLRIGDIRDSVQFQGDTLANARRVEELHREGYRHSLRRENVEAIADFREALRLSTETYGPDSLHSLALSLDLATMLTRTRLDLDEAESLSERVLDVLKKKERTNSDIHLKAMMALTDVYINREELDKAAGKGEECIQIMENWKVQPSAQYFRFQVCMAEFMNQQEQYKTALEHTRKCLNTGFVPSGNDIQYYVRSLREYAFAKVKLEDYDKVPEAFEEMLTTLDRTPGYPVHVHLQYLREYREVLEKLNKSERVGEIDEEILRLEEKERLSKS